MRLKYFRERASEIRKHNEHRNALPCASRRGNEPQLSTHESLSQLWRRLTRYARMSGYSNNRGTDHKNEHRKKGKGKRKEVNGWKGGRELREQHLKRIFFFENERRTSFILVGVIWKLASLIARKRHEKNNFLRVIKFKFLMQPHQKYYFTQYVEFGSVFIAYQWSR